MKPHDYGRSYSLGLNPELVASLQEKYGEAAKNLGKEVFFRSLVALYLEKNIDNIEAGLASPLVSPGRRPALVKVFVADHTKAEIERRFRLEVPFPKQIRILLAAFAVGGEAPPLNVGMRSRWNTASAAIAEA